MLNIANSPHITCKMRWYSLISPSFLTDWSRRWWYRQNPTEVRDATLYYAGTPLYVESASMHPTMPNSYKKAFHILSRHLLTLVRLLALRWLLFKYVDGRNVFSGLQHLLTPKAFLCVHCSWSCILVEMNCWGFVRDVRDSDRTFV